MWLGSVIFEGATMGSKQSRPEQLKSYDDRILRYLNPGFAPVCELVIGLDFGTSTSKVVIRMVDLPNAPAFAVDFGELATDQMPFLLPTQLWVASDGSCSLKCVPGSRKVEGIKVELLDKPEGIDASQINYPSRLGLDPDEIGVAYLALVMRSARAWFLENQSEVARKFKGLIWSVNLGFPSDSTKEQAIDRRFARIGRAAWKVSLYGKATLERARVALAQVDANEEVPTDRDCDLDVVPEIVAASYGYAVSNQRQKGIHLMVDVGASTLDACVFILDERKGDNLFTLLTADVKLLGTLNHFLGQMSFLESKYLHRLAVVRDAHSPALPTETTPEALEIPSTEVQEWIGTHSAEFSRDCKNMVVDALFRARRDKDQLANAWRKGHRLPILVIGGGAKSQVYLDAILKVRDWVEAKVDNDGTRMVVIQWPKGFAVPKATVEEEMPGPREFLSVAWGLSHRSLDIGRISGAEAPDLKVERRRNWRENFVGKDQV